ncbi:MAG: NAD(P)/FAD-dependent oxidoreductase, partial [Phenylobacterium sp.]
MAAYDTIVLGAGPAGLTAATYLARFRRRVLVLGAGTSRASWIPESHNTPGFPHGVSGDELLRRLIEQAAQFGAEIRQAPANRLTRAKALFEVSTAETKVRAPTVLLATGVVDRMPRIAGLKAAVRRGLVRMCPICDAYEAIDKRVAVLGDSGLAQREAAFLRTYSQKLTVIGAKAGRLSFTETEVQWADPDGRLHVFDHLYLALGCEPQSALAVSCGAQRDKEGNLVVDLHQMTSVDGLFSAGDVVRGLNQIAV